MALISCAVADLSLCFRTCNGGFYFRNKTSVWHAEMSSGSHMVYRWLLEEQVITTSAQVGAIISAAS